MDSMPDDFITASTVDRLEQAEGVASALPIVSADRLDTAAASIDDQPIAVIYLSTGVSKHLCGYSEADGGWVPVESVEDSAVESTPETFEATLDDLHAWVESRLDQPAAVHLGTFETNDSGYPF